MDGLAELGLFSLEKRRLWGDLTAAFQYVKGAYRKDGDNLFNKACCIRTGIKSFKLREDRFRLNVGKNFFTMRVAQVAQRGSGGPIPRNIQGQVGWALSNPIQLKMSLLAAWGLG